jgi:predicted transcriptional regulator
MPIRIWLTGSTCRSDTDSSMGKGLRLTGWFQVATDPLHAALGHLEREVMEVVWMRSDQCVRDVQTQLTRRMAYTTVMTTLDRLFKKGFISRRRQGRAYLYSAALSRSEVAAALTNGVLRRLMAAESSSARPFLSNLVDAVTEGDAALLDELERLVRDKRQQMADTEKDSQ